MRTLFTLFLVSFFGLHGCGHLKRDKVTYVFKRTPSALEDGHRGDKVGIEATLTNQTLQEHARVLPPQLDEYLVRLAERIKIVCPDCQVNSYMGPSFEEEYKVTFPDGYSLNLGRDQRVIEVTGTPIEYENLEKHTKKITEVLLAAGEGMGLRPAKNTGGGHLHLDFEAFFKSDVFTFRDFMVDSFNNSFLYEGFFGGEVNNAPSLRQLPKSSQENFVKIIEDFDRKPFSLFEFISRLESEVYHQTFSPNFTPPQKYQAISLIHALRSGGTIEFRNVRPYQSGDSVELISKALFARRDHLERNYGEKKILDLKKGLLGTKLSKKERFNRTLGYLSQSGLNSREYFRLFPSEQFDEALDYYSRQEKVEVLLNEYVLNTAFDDSERFLKVLKSKQFKQLPRQELSSLAYLMVSKVANTKNEELVFKEIIKRTPLKRDELVEFKKERLKRLQGPSSCSSLLEPLL